MISQKDEPGQSEHVFIIIIVFGVILTILVIVFAFNCVRKLVRDHKIIRVSIFVCANKNL